MKHLIGFVSRTMLIGFHFHSLYSQESRVRKTYFNILTGQDRMVKNMMVVLTVERYTMAKGVSARVTGKNKVLYMIDLCMCVLNKSGNLVTAYDFYVRIKEMSKLL